MVITHLRKHLILLPLLGLLLALIPGAGPSHSVLAAPSVTRDEEIIFLTNTGCIRVLDTNTPGDVPRINFDTSRFGECGWTDFVVGNFNADDGYEIAALGNFNGSGLLRIYDPVAVSPPADARVRTGEIDGVVWAAIYQRVFQGNFLQLIGAGNMDQAAGGDEILIGYDISEPNNINFRLEVIKRTNNEGTDWVNHLTKSFGSRWKSVAVGNLNGAGSDDVVLLRDIPSSGNPLTHMESHEIDNDFKLIPGLPSPNNDYVWRSAVIGQIYPGGTGEIAATRTFYNFVDASSTFIYQLISGSLTDVKTLCDQPRNPGYIDQCDAQKNYPYFDLVFLADINGNGDDEVFFKRTVPRNIPNIPKNLIMRNRGSDTNLRRFEVLVDDNYNAGAGGDIDADGLDEMVIMSPGNLRIFSSPNLNDLTNDNPVSTNGRSLAVADLDADGYVLKPVVTTLAVSPTIVEHYIQAGTIDNAWVIVNVSASGQTANVPFTAELRNTTSWILSSGLIVTGNQTPAQLQLKFDATQLIPGLYLGPSLHVHSTGDVVNPDITIPIALRVTEADITVNPGAGRVVVHQVDNVNTPITRNFVVGGTPGVHYTAAIMARATLERAQTELGEVARFGYVNQENQLVLVGSTGSTGVEFNTGLFLAPTQRSGTVGETISWPSSVPWASASSTLGQIPDTLTVTYDASQFGSASGYGQAMLILIGDAKTGDIPHNLTAANVTLMVSKLDIHLPFLSH